MNADQRPSSDPGHRELSRLTLVLPGHLDYDQVLEGLVRAIEEVRADMASFTRCAQRNERGHATRGDRFHTALCRGQAQAGERAVDAIDEAIAGVFDLWYQLDAQAESHDQDTSDPNPEPPGPPPIPRPR
jgi:hypothetical protein